MQDIALILARCGGAVALGLGNIEEGRISVASAVDIARRICDRRLETLAYVRRTPHVAWQLLFSTATLFAAVYFPLVPVYARDVFGGGATEFGFLMGAQGAGLLVGSLTMGRYRRHAA